MNGGPTRYESTFWSILTLEHRDIADTFRKSIYQTAQVAHKVLESAVKDPQEIRTANRIRHDILFYLFNPSATEQNCEENYRTEIGYLRDCRTPEKHKARYMRMRALDKRFETLFPRNLFDEEAAATGRQM